MKTKLACIASVALFALLIPVTTFAVAPQATGTPTMADLVEQIKALQSQVAQLTAELAATKKEVAIIKEELRITKTLRFGMTDEEVEKLQEFLSTMPDIYPEGLVTGYFGALTERAVKKWQEGNGIESVGIVGPKTRAKLAEVTSSHSPGVSSSVAASVNFNATSTSSGLENRAENHPTTTPSGTVPATPAIPAEPIGQTGTTTVSATPAIPATPAPASTPPTTPPVTQYTITVTQGTNGTISPGTTSVTSGGSQTFTITPASSYQIASVTVDGVSQGAISTYTFSSVTASHTITASFMLIPVVSTVTVGAKLSDYVQPTGAACNINVPAQYATIQAGINAAASGNTVCVGPGVYNDSAEWAVFINKPLRLSGSGFTNTSTVNSGSAPYSLYTVYINAPDVTLEGFVINGASANNPSVLISADAGNNIKVQYNRIVSGEGGVAIRSDSSLNNYFIQNNIITGANSTSMVFLMGSTVLPFTVSNNTFNGTINAAGNSGALHMAAPGTIERNVFDVSGVGWLIAYGCSSGTANIHNNNFNSNTTSKVTACSGTANAENNWWGDLSPAGYISGDVDFTPFATSPFTEN